MLIQHMIQSYRHLIYFEVINMQFHQSDGHTEKLEIKKEGLGGVQWKIRESEERLTRNSRKKQPV